MSSHIVRQARLAPARLAFPAHGRTHGHNLHTTATQMDVDKDAKTGLPLAPPRLAFPAHIRHEGDQDAPSGLRLAPQRLAFPPSHMTHGRKMHTSAALAQSQAEAAERDAKTGLPLAPQRLAFGSHIRHDGEQDMVNGLRVAPERMAFGPAHKRGMHTTAARRGDDKDTDMARERIPTGSQPTLDSANADQTNSLSDRERLGKSFVEAERNAERDAGKDAGKLKSSTVDQAVRDDERK